jgi:hypothetical protein
MPNKRKDFLKKYSASTKGTTGGTAYSGRGVGITPGAIGGGDDYKQKIGRGKIPWNLRDFQGSPSMSADAGFSSIAVKRVASPDSVTQSRKPMFPGQDEKDSPDSDIYELDGEDLTAEGRMKDKVLFDENTEVKNTRYSLSRVDELMLTEDVPFKDMIPDALSDLDARDFIPDGIEDEVLAARDHVIDFLDSVKERYGDPAFEYVNKKIEDVTGRDPGDAIEKAAEVAKEVARDVVMLAAAGTPIVGTPIAASFILYNLGEMQVGMNQARRVVDKLIVQGNEFDVDELEKVTSQLYNDYIDFLQAVPYLIPFFGAAKGATRIVSKAAKALGGKKASTFLGLTGSGVFGSALRSEIFLSPIFKFITSQSDVESLDDVGIDSTYFFDNVYKVPAALAVLSDLREEAETQLSAWESSGRLEPFRFNPEGTDAGDISAAEDRFSLDDYSVDFEGMVSDLAGEISSAAESGDIESAVDSVLKETKMSNEDLIRQFIRETIYHATAGLAAPQPAGYAYRAPHESEPDEDAYKSDPESVVNYKTDMGGVTYSSRPEDLREEALRRIIRRKLQEQKKTS